MKKPSGVATAALAALFEHGIGPVIFTISPIKIAVQSAVTTSARAVRSRHIAFGVEAEEPLHG